MKLLTQEIIAGLPKLYAQDGKGENAIVHAKLFDPCSGWTWYVLEGEQTEDLGDGRTEFELFCLVEGHETEYGYSMLSELEAVRNKLGLPLERELYSGTPCPLWKILGHAEPIQKSA